MSAYPVHVEGEEDLVHVAVGVLAHPLEVEDGLELEQRDEAGRRLSHEHVVPVVHVLGEDVVQVRAVVPHWCGLTDRRGGTRRMENCPRSVSNRTGPQL